MATKGYLSPLDEAVEGTLLADIERSQREQDKDAETRTRPSRARRQVVEADGDGDAVLEEYPWTYSDEWWLLSVLGDYYEDKGLDHWSAAVRWMATAKKRPYKAGEDGWVWFCAGRIAEGIGDEESDLPPEVYERLVAFDLEEASQKRYKEFRVAFEWCVSAWIDAVAEGWVPAPKEGS